MTYGTVGEGKSLVGQLFWVLFEIFGLVFVATYMSITGAWLGWNALEWDTARFSAFLSLLMGGLAVALGLQRFRRRRNSAAA